MFHKFFLIVFLLGFQIMAQAAKPVQPPVKALVNPYHRIIVATGASELQGNKAEFHVSKVLFGDDIETILLAMKPAAVQEYQKGKKYLIVYSEVIKHPVVRDEKVINPDGPTIVDYIILKSALLDYSDGLVDLFENEINGQSKLAQKSITHLLKELRSRNPLNRQFAAFELKFRPEYYAYFTSEQVSGLQSILKEKVLDDELTTYVLTTFYNLKKVDTQKWLVKYCQQLINARGAQLELASFAPGLVKEAADILGNLGDEKALSSLETLVYSNSPSVARVAFQSIVEINAAEAKNVAAKAIEKNALLKDTRRILEQYIKQ